MLPIILAIIISQSTPATISVKGTKNISYRMYVNNDKLCFQYKYEKNWSEPTKLDSGDISEYSIAITSGDNIHIAYCKNQRVCYRTTLEPITKEFIKYNKKPHWSTWIFVSPYFTEPAYNISIRINGIYLNIIWQTPAKNNLEITETWKRIKLISDPLYSWYTPECLSKTNLRK